MNSRVFELRNTLGMSMKEFGEKLGLSISGISDIEKGRTSVGEKHIKLILAAFPQVSEDWLRTGEGEMMKSSSAGQMDALIERLDLPAIARAFVEIYEELPESSRRIVLDYAHRVISDLMVSAGANAGPADPNEDIKRAIAAQFDLEKNPEDGFGESPSIDSGMA